MHVILLSGGSGTRLWPLSNEVRSKQFLKIFKTENGHESMAQRMYRMIKEVDPDADITIATSQNQIAQIKTQLGDNVDISVEPCRRDTFPAIALASAYLVKKGVSLNEPVVVCPVDPFVGIDYFRCLKKLADTANNGKYNLSLMGINPTYPSEKYGYILVDGEKVKGFTEKPDETTATEYIKSGALWNGGVFAFKLEYIINIVQRRFGYSDYDALYKNYDLLEKISFDYAVAEKEKNIGVIKYDGEWKDLGTWNTLTEAMKDFTSGQVTMAGCNNTHAINELGIPLVALGVNDAVIAATPDGILISDKEMSTHLKDYVVPNRPMYERRQWGEYKVLDYHIQAEGINSLTKHLIILPGMHISYQLHKHRTETWTIVEGNGKLILDGLVSSVKTGDSITINAGTKHAIKADTELHIIEVQLGDELTEDDIERLDYNWMNV